MGETDNKSLTVDEIKHDTSTAIAAPTSAGMKVEGLEGVPISDIPLPRVKLITATTKKVNGQPIKEVTDADGKKLTEQIGKYYNENTGKTMDTLEFIILRAKKDMMEVEDPKTKIKENKQVYKFIAVDPESLDVFFYLIGGTSVWNFRTLLGKISSRKVSSVWELHISARPEERDGDYGSYLTNVFDIKEKIEDEGKLEFLKQLYVEWGGALDSNNDSEEEENEADKFAEQVFNPGDEPPPPTDNDNTPSF